MLALDHNFYTLNPIPLIKLLTNPKPLITPFINPHQGNILVQRGDVKKGVESRVVLVDAGYVPRYYGEKVSI